MVLQTYQNQETYKTGVVHSVSSLALLLDFFPLRLQVFCFQSKRCHYKQQEEPGEINLGKIK